MPDVLIEESTGKVDVGSSSFFYFGVPKWGKSELAAGYPNTMTLASTVKEVQKLKVPYILCNSWEKYKNAIDYICSKRFRKSPQGKATKTIVVDVFDTMYENCEEYAAKELGIKNIKDAGWGRGESRTDQEFRKSFRKLIGSRYGVVLISHWDTRDIETRTGTVKKNVCTLPPRIKKVVLRDVNVIGFCTFETKKVRDEETGKKKRVKKRVIIFEPSQEFETGDNDGFLPSKLYIKHGKREYSKTYQKIKDFYNGKKGGHEDDTV